jgi:hypothetical protein
VAVYDLLFAAICSANHYERDHLCLVRTNFPFSVMCV